MSPNRLEAFSDGVIAIIITIMVLELRPPHVPTWSALGPLWPVILSYVMSFVYLGIYWNNHHHMLHLTRRVTGGILWANLHLLFWLSLTPFTTAWMGETHFAAVPTAVYGVVLLACAVAYYVLQRHDHPESGTELDPGRGRRQGQEGKALAGPVPARRSRRLRASGMSGALYATVALIWLIPDTRIERVLAARGAAGELMDHTAS